MKKTSLEALQYMIKYWSFVLKVNPIGNININRLDTLRVTTQFRQDAATQLIAAQLNRSTSTLWDSTSADVYTLISHYNLD